MKNRKIRKILFVSPPFQSFIEKDYEILRRKFQTQSVTYSYERKRCLLLLVPRIIRGVIWADLTYCWFGSFHAFFTVFFSKLLHKKSIIVAGGYDVARMPEINYGLMNARLWRFFPIFSFKLCDKILAVSHYTKKEVIENLNIAEEKIDVVTHGFDTDKFHPKGKKEDTVITIGKATSGTLIKKGLITFAKAARLLSDVNFYAIGGGRKDSIEELRRINSCNLSCEGFIPHEDLVRFMQRAKVYLQVSAHESFGCALAEAMLCECVPVVTDRGALPEVVGDTGYYVLYDDVETTADMIKRALKDSEVKGKKARKRIEETFPIEKREKNLIKVIERLEP